MRFVLQDLAGRGFRACAGVRGRMRAGRCISSLLLHPAEQRVVKIALRSGVSFYVDPTVDLQETIFWTGEYDTNVIERMKHLLPPDAVVLDVGANIGAYALQLAHVLQSRGRIIAIEPVPANSKRLRENIALNGMTDIVEVVDSAVGDHSGLVYLRNALNREGMTGNAVVAEDGIAARLVTIDEIAETYALRRCDLIKLDIEGCEFAALRGAECLLKKYRPVLYLELNAHWMKHFCWTVSDLLGYLGPLGYELTNDDGQPLDVNAGRVGVESVWGRLR